MKAHSRVVVERKGRLAELHCEPPLTMRQIRTDEAETCALCQVATAAGPLAGDDLTLDLALRAGASATLQAAGASLAQGTGGGRTLHTTVTLDAGARLVARPAPLIVTQGGRIDVAVSIDLAADAAVEWHELIVLGRSGEPPGAATLRWDVTREGRPVLRQFVDLADPRLASWRGMANGARVLSTALVSDPLIEAHTIVHSDNAVTAKLDGCTTLTTRLSSEVASMLTSTAAARVSATG